MWSVVNGKNTFNMKHNHPNSYFSGAYYIKTNEVSRSKTGKMAWRTVGPELLTSLTQLVHPILHNPIWINKLPKPFTLPLEYDGSKSTAKSVYYIPTCTSRLFAISYGRNKSIYRRRIK